MLCIVLAGCSAPKTYSSPQASAPAKPVVTAPAEVADTTLDRLPKRKATKPVLPDELKNDAYEYFGLGSSKPLDLEESTSESPQTITGSQIIRPLSVENGVAKYRLENTGNLADIGTSELELAKDGLRVTKSSVAKIGNKPSLELPASLKPGVTWQSEDEIDSAGRSLKIHSTLKVVGTTTVKTKRGELEALLVESKGSGTENGATAEIKSRSWYVKGVGNVKTVIEQKVAGKTSTITIQISH